ncbi:cobalamin-binding protein [Pseudomonas sp.]|uniref:cobalamin-binding protein n=1 Tax=Pseudomonas sp. TaxID=306 RepID=UPI003CC5D182
MAKLLACLLLLLCSSAGAAQRVVSLAPSLTEIAVEVGGQDRLVGVLDAGPRPPGLASLPSVGRYGQLDLEQLLALKPDLILLWPGSVSPAQRDQLQRLHVALLVSEPHSLDDLAMQMERVAAPLGRAARGKQLADEFRLRLAMLRERYRRPVPLQVFYQVWDAPLYTVGGGQIISDALRVCGGRNIFADLALPAPQVSLEAVLQRDPQVIVVPNQAQADAWRKWPIKGRVVIGDPGVERPSGQMLDALTRLCERLNL